MMHININFLFTESLWSHVANAELKSFELGHLDFHIPIISTANDVLTIESDTSH